MTIAELIAALGRKASGTTVWDAESALLDADTVPDGRLRAILKRGRWARALFPRRDCAVSALSRNAEHWRAVEHRVLRYLRARVPGCLPNGVRPAGWAFDDKAAA